MKDAKTSINDNNKKREVEDKEEKIEQNVIFYALRSPQSNYNGNQDKEKQNIIITSDIMKEYIKNRREIDDEDGNNSIDNGTRNFDNNDDMNRSIVNDKKEDSGDQYYSVDKE